MPNLRGIRQWALFRRLDAIGERDTRPLVLAYRSWGRIAGRPTLACNRGNPPCIGVGLMRKLSRRFLVAPTPEHHTSKTCAACGGTCGAHPTLRHTRTTSRQGVRLRREHTIRGLRLCQQEGCKLLQNRDRTGAANIGLQFQLLVDGKPPLRAMSAEEVELHRHSMACAACDNC